MILQLGDVIILEREEFGVLLGGGIRDLFAAKEDFIVGNAEFFFLTHEGDFFHDGEFFFGDFLDGGIIREEAGSFAGFAVAEAIYGFIAFHQGDARGRIGEGEGIFDGDFLVGEEDSIQLFFGFIIDEEVEVWGEKNFREWFGRFQRIALGISV